MSRPRRRALDPRSKLTFVAVVSVLAILTADLRVLGALGGLLAGVVIAGGDLGVRAWVRSLGPLKVVLPVILVLNAVFYGGGEVLVAVPVPWPRLDVTTGGLLTSTVIAVRLVVIAAAAAWVGRTTDPEVLESALVGLRVPWSVAFLLSLTVRLVPELRDRFATIDEAQRSRGIVISGGPLARSRARLPMLVPFLAAVVEFGYELGDALVVRDFGISDRRTSTVRVVRGPADYALFAVSALAVVGFAVVT